MQGNTTAIRFKGKLCALRFSEGESTAPLHLSPSLGLTCLSHAVSRAAWLLITMGLISLPRAVCMRVLWKTKALAPSSEARPHARLGALAGQFGSCPGSWEVDVVGILKLPVHQTQPLSPFATAPARGEMHLNRAESTVCSEVERGAEEWKQHWEGSQLEYIKIV